MRTHEEIRVRLFKKIEELKEEIRQLKEAIKVPRQYFKFREGMKYDHLIEQREQALDKLREEIDSFDPKKNRTGKKYINIAEILNLYNEEDYVQRYLEEAVTSKRSKLQFTTNPLMMRDFSIFSLQSKTTAAGGATSQAAENGDTRNRAFIKGAFDIDANMSQDYTTPSHIKRGSLLSKLGLFSTRANSKIGI